MHDGVTMADREDRICAFRATSQNRVDTSDEFSGRERFDDIVIGSASQTANAVIL